MDEASLSFYLRSGQLHVYIEALRGIGRPERICFMIDEEGKTLLMKPYLKRDLLSHGVPEKVYQGSGCLRLSSKLLCTLVARIHNWDSNYSYRVPGMVRRQERIVVWDLTKAEAIGKERDREAFG